MVYNTYWPTYKLEQKVKKVQFNSKSATISVPE